MNNRLIFWLLMLVGFSNSLDAAETVYVSSKQAKIYKEANFNSELITSLKQYDTIGVIGRQGIWMQVSNIDISGWVSRYLVSSGKPFKTKISILSRLKSFFSSDNRRNRLVLVSTAGGIRGLSEEESDASGRTDFEAVKIMESVSVSEADTKNFIKSNID